MHRHERAEVRYQRERMIKHRRRQFARWLGDADYGTFDDHGHWTGWIQQPRPWEIREVEFWSGWRLGIMAKWNGGSNRKSRRKGWEPTRLERLERILERETREELIA